MKNIFPLLAGLVLVPGLGLAANQPPLLNSQSNTCEQQISAESQAFFSSQSTERGQWGGNNKQTAADIDAHGRAMFFSRQHPDKLVNIPTVPPTEQQAYDAFVAHQLSVKNAFLAKIAQDRQNCLNGQPITPWTPTGSNT